MSTTQLPWITASEVYARVSFADAVRALQRELQDGFDPSTDPERGIVPLSHGQLLLMPSATAAFVGVKVATVAPGNPAIGKERIQGLYLLMDAISLSPIAVIDGVSLTTLRTPAVSAAAADYLAPREVEHLVVFGSGPQAWGHIQAIRAIRDLARVSIVGRDRERAEALARRARESGFAASVGTADDVRDAQVVVCATTARQPLFDGNAVPDDSCTIAVGSHEPDARELDSTLMARAAVVVEDVGVALREGGDVMIPVAEGVLDPDSLVPMRLVVTGDIRPDLSRPRVFKSSGMSWEDLVVAAEVFRRS